MLYLVAVMDVVITEWALQSYADLRGRNVFTDREYRTVLRPDAELLKDGFPSPHPRLQSPSFWGPATNRSGIPISGGFKMKWRNIGPGRVQLRLCVAILQDAFLCHAYVKSSSAVDHREMAKLDVRIG